MKRKIVISLLLLFLFFAAGTVISSLSIRTTTSSLERLISLHQVENLRQDLIMSIQTVQSELYTVGTDLGHKIDTITENVSRLEKNAGGCTKCHHQPALEKKLLQMQTSINDYQNALSFYMTASADKKNIDRLKTEAAAIGNSLLLTTEEMSMDASRKLASMTADAVGKIKEARSILLITIILAFLVGIIIAIRLTSSITGPIGVLLSAVRTIAAGDLGHKVPYQDKTEFGELADNISLMSTGLREGYDKLEKEIAERRQTEAALTKSEAFLSTIFDSIHDPFCIFDREFRIVRSNDAYTAMKSRTIDPEAPPVCYALLHGRDAVCEDCIVSATFLSGDACAKEKTVMDLHGHESWQEIYTYPIVDRDNTITHVIEYTRDITERKKTEAALRESEQRYALAAQGANDGLWDWNLTDNRIYYSIRWKSMLGYSDREVGDSPDEWLSRLHIDDREKVWSRIHGYVLQGNQHLEIEYRIMHKDGNFRWMLCRGLAVRDGKGNSSRMAGSQTDITARKKAEEQLLHDAFHDALTGLANRALFRDRLHNAINRSKRLKQYLYAVMFFDVDRFKVINDSLGHAAGDKLLIGVSRRMADCVRPGDTVARLGGDEFAVLLENVSDVTDVRTVVERIQTEMAAPFLIDGNELYVTQSIGIALEQDRYEQPDQILSDADIAMYAAKAKGKARYEIFDDSMHSYMVERLQLEADLRVAVEHLDEFVLHYQPILDVATRKLSGFEALVRWQHPVRGLIPPMEFIPLAEETGLIQPLGEWVLREACRQLNRWQREYHTAEPLKMSANVSGRQFLNDNFVDVLLGIIGETGIAPETLAIEITESIIMENLEVAVIAMNRLRDSGIKIHIDDFGTGYSSLSYLNKFPVTALKIDRSFIANMSLNDENREIVKAIVTLAQNLKLEVIAEGIELSSHLDEIDTMDCHFAQGFFFSRPKAAPEIAAWMLKEAMVRVRN
ncbi:MAG: EAL domain-containing protein [Nitrospirae bacterium]|nr:EAL domain-containing protein [Nitrospirota bacterium]